MKNMFLSKFFQIEEIKLIINLLSLDNESSMFVGGVVRDLLQFNECKTCNVDIATTITPDRITNILVKNNIKPISIGFEFGTVSAFINKYRFDITTLRSEISFEGRNPKVIFTKDWNVDAKRRDFTINAIYLNFAGNIFDPLTGRDNLLNGEVKFIGKPSDRIKEDPLRIFRYFRFLGKYSKSAPDIDSLLACSKSSILISKLSKNRITTEFFEILKIPNPMYAIDLMIESGVLQQFFPQASRPDRLEFLYNLESSAGIHPDYILRLVSLIHVPEKGKQIIIKKLKKIFIFTKKEFDQLVMLLETYSNFSENMHIAEIKKYLYELNSHKKFFDVLLINWVKDGSSKDYRKVIEKVASLEIPKFPIPRKKLVSIIRKKENISILFKELENFWIDSGFEKNQEECIDYLNNILKN
tara:strand:+ start:3254 stop:4492 length:1239 start_codon:yes stop_codon:yes gene_type:complete